MDEHSSGQPVRNHGQYSILARLIQDGPYLRLADVA
jgi:hypothetical protein